MGTTTRGNEEHQDWECCVEKRSNMKGVGEARNEEEEHRV